MEPYPPQQTSAYDDTPIAVTEHEARMHQKHAQLPEHYGGGHGAQGYLPGYINNNPQEMPIAVTGKKRVCGLTKKMLLLVIAAAVLLAGCIGAAAAAGVLASQKSDAEKKLSDVRSSPSSPGSSPSSPGSSPSSPGSSSGDDSSGEGAANNTLGIMALQVQSDWGGSEPSCPDSGGETYTVPGDPSIKFKRECNTNYPGGDLLRVPMSTMEDCIKMCAMFHIYPQSADGRCLMVNWIYSDLQGTNDSWCWLKNAKGTGVSRTNAETAFVVDDEGTYIGNDAKFSGAA